MKPWPLFLAILVALAQGAFTQNTSVFASGRLPRTVKPTMSTEVGYNAEKYVGQWKMSSWNGIYRLFEDGRCTLVNPDDPGVHQGIWFLAYDRLYLVWSWGPVDFFTLNPNNHTVLQRGDHGIKNVTLEKKIN